MMLIRASRGAAPLALRHNVALPCLSRCLGVLSHVEGGNTVLPRMVDITHKGKTHRRAVAEAHVRLPQKAWVEYVGAAKAAIDATAIVAGVMAAKRTPDAIPFCHTVAVDACDIKLEAQPAAGGVGGTVRITAAASTNSATGIEMEAMHAASLAALTVYDMCKAAGPDIEITAVRLLHKSGGKSTFNASVSDDVPATASSAATSDR